VAVYLFFVGAGWLLGYVMRSQRWLMAKGSSLRVDYLERRGLVGQVQQEIGDAEQEVQDQQNQAGKYRRPGALALQAPELRAAVVPFHLGCYQGEMDVGHFVFGTRHAGEHLLKANRWGFDSDTGKSATHPPCPPLAENLISHVKLMRESSSFFTKGIQGRHKRESRPVRALSGAQHAITWTECGARFSVPVMGRRHPR
jgi:hypothetical protein